MKKSFHLGDVLSITHDRLVSPRHMEGVYDICNWLTQDNLFTHQLPRVHDECRAAQKPRRWSARIVSSSFHRRPQ